MGNDGLGKQFDILFKAVSSSEQGRNTLLRLFELKKAIVRVDYEKAKDQLVFSDTSRSNALILNGELRLLDEFIKKLGE